MDQDSSRLLHIALSTIVKGSMVSYVTHMHTQSAFTEQGITPKVMFGSVNSILL